MFQHVNSNGNTEKCRILMAEDCPDSQLIISHLLTSEGATVTTVDNGKECLDEALIAWNKSEPYDIILLDIQMPVLDGHETARQLRGKGYDLPIVAMTARTVPNDEKETLKAGCDVYVSKLNGKEGLLSAIASQLRTDTNLAKGELPVLPMVPDYLRFNPEYAAPALKFLNKLPGVMRNLETYVKEKNWVEIKNISADLGSASLYGYNIFTVYLSDMQAIANEQNERGMDRLFSQIKRTSSAMLSGQHEIRSIEESFKFKSK